MCAKKIGGLAPKPETSFVSYAKLDVSFLTQASLFYDRATIRLSSYSTNPPYCNSTFFFFFGFFCFVYLLFVCLFVFFFSSRLFSTRCRNSIISYFLSSLFPHAVQLLNFCLYGAKHRTLNKQDAYDWTLRRLPCFCYR